jgi:threonine dehydrogenase-like Zn-dependent dehydrogenase
MALGIGLKTPLPFLRGGPTAGFKPSSVLVLGGSSALGAATIQLLRLSVPDCLILTTSSPKHHEYIRTILGADGAFDRDSSSLVEEVKTRTPKSQGVDAIIDAVGAGSTQKILFDTFDPSGPKRYAQVWTGDKEIDAPSGVESVLFRGRDLPTLPGNENIMESLEKLLKEKKYQLPLPVRKLGHGFHALEMGLSLMRQGVSGEKLVVNI